MRTLWKTLPYNSGYWSGWRMYSSTPSFDSSLVLNDSGSSSTSPSRLPRMLVEYHPASPSIRALNAGRRPDHHQAVGARRLLERADIRAQLLGQVALRLTRFDMRAVQALHIAAVERGRHGLDAPQEIAHRLEVVRLEHTGLLGRGVRVIRNRVPGREHQVGELREGHELPDLRDAALGAFAEPDRRHLPQRPDRQRAATPHVFHAANERRGDSSQPHEHHPERPLSARDLPAGLNWHDQCPFRDCSAGA